eukprot:45422_1
MAATQTLITKTPNPSSKRGSQFKVVCTNSNALKLTIFLGIYFSISAAGGLIIPVFGAYWFGGCITNDTTMTVKDDECDPDYTTYNLWSTIFWSISGFITFLFAGFFGRLSDSYGRKTFILLCILAYAIPRGILIFYVNLYVYWILSMFTDINIFVFSASFADIFTGSQSSKTIAYAVLFAMLGLGVFSGALFAVIISYIWDNHTVFIALGIIYIFLTAFWYFGITETLETNLRKTFTTRNCNPFKPLFRIIEDKIILYCSMVQFVLEFDNIVAFSITQSFIGDQFGLKGEFETNLIFGIIAVVGGFGNVLQGFILMPMLKKYKISNLNILLIGCIMRIIGLYGLAMSPIIYRHGIELAVISCFILGIGSIGTPANIGIASHYLDKCEQGVGLGVIDSYKSVAKIIGPASMGYVYYRFSDSDINIPSMHWYICIVLRIVILIVIIGPFAKLLKYKINQQHLLKKTNKYSVDEDKSNNMVTELVLPTHPLNE